ncbi:MAG: ATP-binding cassette domain-containing protein [Oligoflexia bacterium]|nr:ATP-binding cassette domain-containing protein [Oligoflexia bacterium]
MEEIKKITIQSGVGKFGDNEDKIDNIELKMGQVVSIVGPTGSGKTNLINDIALFANRNTPSNRRVLINDALPPSEYIEDPSKNPVSYITQHTNFLSDLPVYKFLSIHAKIRNGHSNNDAVVEETLDFANKLTGEPINKDGSMTALSGGQTRSLLISDAVVIGNSPIILLDEIENAGIHRTRALELLRNYKKIFIFVTHDPRITLLSDFRVIMKNGAIQNLITTNENEKKAVLTIKNIDDLMLELRMLIRDGQYINPQFIRSKIVHCLSTIDGSGSGSDKNQDFSDVPDFHNIHNVQNVQNVQNAQNAQNIQNIHKELN